MISGLTVLTDPSQNGFSVDGRPGDLGSKLSVTIDGLAEDVPGRAGLLVPETTVGRIPDRGEGEIGAVGGGGLEDPGLADVATTVDLDSGSFATYSVTAPILVTVQVQEIPATLNTAGSNVSATPASRTLTGPPLVTTIV